jgi:type II secretory pathway pseudopilin PulG
MNTLKQTARENRYQLKGSTLIEAMLAIAILVIALFGTSSTFIRGRKQIVSQQFYRGAAHLASQKIEEIKAMKYTDVNETNVNDSVSLYGCAYSRHTQIALTAAPSAGTPKPCKKVTVTIGWTGAAGDSHTVKLATYVGP